MNGIESYTAVMRCMESKNILLILFYGCLVYFFLFNDVDTSLVNFIYS